MKKIILVVSFIMSVTFIVSNNSEEITEENYRKLDKEIWDEY